MKYKFMYAITEAFNSFTGKMLDKWFENEATGARHGWDNSQGDFGEKQIIKRMKKKLQQIENGERQEADLANYAMFLSYQRDNKEVKQ